MSHDPVRLRDDAVADSRMRADLRLSAAVPVAFDVDRALERFNQSVASGAVETSSSLQQSRAILRRGGRWWGTVAIGLATVLLALGYGLDRTRNRAAAPATVGSEQRSNSAGAVTSSEAALATREAAGGAIGSRPLEPSQASSELPGVGPREGSADPEGSAAGNSASSRAGHNALLVATSAGSGSHVDRVGTLSGATSAIPHFERTVQERTARVHVSRTSAIITAGGHGSVDLLHRERSQLTDAYSQFERNPAGALALATAGNREFASGRHVEEREALAIRSLARLRRGAEARVRAQRFLDRYPHGSWTGLIREIAN